MASACRLTLDSPRTQPRTIQSWRSESCAALCQVSVPCWLKGFQKTGPLSSDRSENSSTASSSNTTAPRTAHGIVTVPGNRYTLPTDWLNSETPADARPEAHTHKHESPRESQRNPKPQLLLDRGCLHDSRRTRFFVFAAFHASDRPQISAPAAGQKGPRPKTGGIWKKGSDVWNAEMGCVLLGRRIGRN